MLLCGSTTREVIGMPIIGVVVSDEEKELIFASAKSRGLSASSFLRTIGLQNAKGVQV